jgi:hypothetical protein
MSKNSTQLVSASGYDVNNIIFSEPVKSTIDGKPPINFQRVMISTLNPDGTSGELVIPTELLFSFGPSVNMNKDTGKANGYVMPL